MNNEQTWLGRMGRVVRPLGGALLALWGGAVAAAEVQWSVGVYAPPVSVSVGPAPRVVLAPAGVVYMPAQVVRAAPAYAAYEWRDRRHKHRHHHHRCDEDDRGHGGWSSHRSGRWHRDDD